MARSTHFAFNTQTNQPFEVIAQQVINAAGIWGQGICEYAELDIKMFPAKGSLLILDYRINNLVINRCRKPSDADILVPGDTISLIGTTSEHIDYDMIDDLHVTAVKLAPIMKNTRVLRAYAGVRPLVSLSGDSSGRNISRGIVLLDHQERDGLKGLTTITGGKLMTYRLMAERPCLGLSNLRKRCVKVPVSLSLFMNLLSTVMGKGQKLFSLNNLAVRRLCVNVKWSPQVKLSTQLKNWT